MLSMLYTMIPKWLLMVLLAVVTGLAVFEWIHVGEINLQLSLTTHKLAIANAKITTLEDSIKEQNAAIEKVKASEKIMRTQLEKDLANAEANAKDRQKQLDNLLSNIRKDPDACHGFFTALDEYIDWRVR
jgi:hypothetical protein